MAAFERAPAFPVNTTVGVEVAGGSPSSSTSCGDSHQVASASQPIERPLPKRERHFRKPAPPSVTTVATRRDADPEEPDQVPVAQALDHKSNRRKPIKQWEEEDIRAPGPRVGQRRAAGSGPALRGIFSQAAALNVTEETMADPHSPVSDDSTRTRRNSAPGVAECRRSSLDAVSQEAQQQVEEEEVEMRPKGKLKQGGPCHVCWVTKATAWRSGRVDGLFAGATMCNKHGTLDKRGRLWMYCDEQGIIELHESALTDKEKAAASKKFLKNPKAARNVPAKVHRTRAAATEEEKVGVEAAADGRSRVRRKPVKVAKRQGRADASQPWGATSPTRVKAASQATGGRKRKAPSGSYDDDAAPAEHTMASQKRLCFEKQAEPAVPVERDGRSNTQLNSLVDDYEEMETEMDIDTERLCDIDPEMGGAVASLLSMRKSGSSDMESFVI